MKPSRPAVAALCTLLTGALGAQESAAFWDAFARLPWVQEARERNERRRPVCSSRLPEAEKQVAANPRDADSWMTIGRCKLKSGAVDEAISAYRNAVRVDSYTGEGFALLGHALLAKGDREYAREMFQSAITIDDEEDQAYRGLGAYYAQTGKVADAIENYEIALKLANPRGPNAFNPDDDYRTVAFLYAKLDKPKLAVRAFERAVEVAVIDSELRLHLGLALDAAGQREKALEQAVILENSGEQKLANELRRRIGEGSATPAGAVGAASRDGRE